MNYKITCVCGHQFQVSDDQVQTELECPVCHQRLKPAVASALAPQAASTPAMPSAATNPAAAPDAPPSPQAPVPSPTEASPSSPASDPVSAAPPAPIAAPAVSAAPPAAPAASPPVEPNAEPTKRCPFCGEVILAVARKCKHCNEFLDRVPQTAAPAAPPAHSGAIQPGTAAAALAPNAAAAPIPSPNDLIYSLTSSQWDNFWRYLTIGAAFFFLTVVFWFVGSYGLGHGFSFIATLGALVVGGFAAWFFYLRTHSTHIRIHPFRIDVESGILSKNLESLELFRITDTELKQSLIERIIGIGTINLMTSDSSSEPELTLPQIPHARDVLKYLQTQIPIAARQRGAVYLEK